MRSKSTITKSNTSKLIEQKMLNDYKYAIGTAKQAGDYNKTTNYQILHIRKTYENGGDIAVQLKTKNLSILTHLHPNSRYQQLFRQ